jgi:excisionase family DNA binding protein
MDDTSGEPEITTSEAAEILGVNQATVTRWAAAGKLRHWRTPGGQRRFRREDIEALRRPIGPATAEAAS